MKDRKTYTLMCGGDCISLDASLFFILPGFGKLLNEQAAINGSEYLEKHV
jgi:hypothetical protein